MPASAKCASTIRTSAASSSRRGRAPRGPLGFVAWVDNQWAVATPRGRFGWGLLASSEQWLDLGVVQIEAMD